MKFKKPQMTLTGIINSTLAVLVCALSTCSAFGYLDSEDHRANMMAAGAMPTPHPVAEERYDDEAPRLIPGGLIALGNGNYAGGQLTEDQFEKLMQRTNIKTVVRMNLESRGELILRRAKEGALCIEGGARYIEENIEGKNNRCNEKALARIDAELDRGNTYVHCTDGAYRSMLAAARYLARHTKDDYDTIAAKVGWTPQRIGQVKYRRYFLNAMEHHQNQRQPAR